MFLALAFFVFMGPCAYYWWFRTLYNAARSDSTLKSGRRSPKHPILSRPFFWFSC